MWMFTKYGFYSAVCAREGSGRHGHPVDSSRIMVRARLRSHLEAQKGRFPELLGGSDIKDFLGTDYAFRIFVDKPVWSQVVAGLIDELDYDNFKSEVTEEDFVKVGKLKERHSVDHICVSQKLQDRVECVQPWEGDGLSDHNGVWVDLQVQR